MDIKTPKPTTDLSSKIKLNEKLKKQIEEEYLVRKQDMFDKYYGNEQKKIEYRLRMRRYKNAIEEKEFSYIDKNGNPQTGTYKTIKPYAGLERDEGFLQLEEFSSRLERISKAEAGDISVYKNLPKEKKQEDKHYLETNNESFDSYKYTQKDLKTLAKYGEKVPYLKLKEKQPLRNVLKGIVNVPTFLRNHITAPINKFVGSKIVAPIHRIIYPEEESIYSPYKNNMNHRYVARRDYFADNGDGYFKSRVNALFKSKEGNEAVLRAGASDIKDSIKNKVLYDITKEIKMEEDKKAINILDIDIEKLRKQLKITKELENRKIILKELDEKNEQVSKLVKLQYEMEKDNEGLQTIQTDAISEKQHAIASKEVNTRKIAGVKMIAKGTVVKYVGPKLKNWLLEHTQKKITTTVQGTDIIKKDKVWIEPVTEEVECISAENLSKIKVGDLLQNEKTVDYAVGLGRTKEAITDLEYSRGIAITLENGSIIAATDGKGFDITGISNIQLDPSLLDSSGNLDLNSSIFDVIASVKNTAQDTSITAKDIISEITSLSTVQEQTEALKSYFGNISIAESINETGMFSGWNEKSGEILNLINNGTIKTINTQSVIKPGYWDTIETVTKGNTQTISKLVDNERVVNVLKTLGIVAKGEYAVGTVDDIYENLRKTTTKVKTNKSKQRDYKFDDGESFDKQHILKQKKNKNSDREESEDSER